MRVVTVNRPDRKLTKNKKYSEITPPKLGCQFEIQKFWIYYSILYIYTYSVLGPAIQAQSPPSSSVKPKAEIPDTWRGSGDFPCITVTISEDLSLSAQID